MSEQKNDSVPNEGNAIEIDGKKLGPEEIKNILAQQAEATKASQAAAKALAAAQRYNVDIDTYVQNAEASFSLMQELISQGIIDETGKLVVKKEAEQQKPAAAAPTQPAQRGQDASRADDVADKALAAFREKFSALEKEIEDLKETNLGLMRLRLQDKLSAQYPDLDEDDISRIMAAAYKSNKPITELAKEVSEGKRRWLEEREMEWAKKYGINIDEIKRRKQLIEQSPEGGAGILFKGKKFVFDPKKGDTSAVTPKKAMQEYLDAIFRR